MESIEMLKALYDFQAVYPKTISFEEGEYFILYQTSARQRNWWQVVSMKGNIGFVPSNYVTKIKVEPDFLISFLDSSIESLEKCKEVEINGIMPKDELLERLCEKKHAMEKMYLENSERDADADSSWSFSQSIDDNKYSKIQYKQQQQLSKHSGKRLDSYKKSQSSPMVGVVAPQIVTDSLSNNDTMHLHQTQSAMDLSLSLPSTFTNNTKTTTTITMTTTTTTTCTTPTTTNSSSIIITTTTTPSGTGNSLLSTVTTQQQQQQITNKAATAQQHELGGSSSGGGGGQDNSITSEPSEPTTTTTTTSEDVVTTFKDLTFNRQSFSQSLHTTPPQNEGEINENDGRGSGGCGDGEIGGEGGGGGGGTIAEISEQIMLDDKAEAEKSSDASEAPSVARDDIELAPNSADISPGLDSESSSMRAQLQAAAVAALTATAASYPRPNLTVESSDVYQIVDVIRRSTNLSFDMSCEALRVVLTSLEQLYNGAINPYLEAVAVHVTDRVDTPKELLGITHDAKRLQYIFTQLADCKNDSEQRTWMLYEDEDDILQFLEELVEILNNADENISCYEMSCDQYQVLNNLVQYYQMETRWPIKKLLLKTFTAACHLDHVIVDILLTSVLPLEIVEDMKTHFSNLDRFKQLVKMLTIIFSLGQPMPVNHQDYLGVHFASFLLEIVEGNNPENLVDLVISLILAFNMQFTEFSENVVIEAMQALPTAKVFTEKILLLLNREEDPTRLLKHTNTNMNSVLKMFIDIFSNSDTAGMFYTNDNKVLIDILVRQLSDLCAGNPMRRCYLELCRRILRNTNYSEHQHRKQDLMKIFTRIFCEETECSASDQKLVREIANEFPQLFKA